MNRFESFTKPLMWLMPWLLVALTAGCGGGQDTILGASVTSSAIAPTVTATVPLATTPIVTGVAINTKITASFSSNMAPATVNTSTFTVACPAGTAVAGTVSYVAASRVATFSPTANLPINTPCTATITTGAQDTAGAALANPFVWTFATGATADTIQPTVTLLNPADLATGVCLQKRVNATFSEAMDPSTITTTTMTLQLTGPPLGALVAGAVTYDVTSKVATFAPTSALLANTNYTATITTGVKDLTGNALASNRVWSFTTGAQSCSPVASIALRTAAPFGNLGGTAGTTNTGTLTIMGGDLGSTATTTSSITGFHDTAGDIYTETPANIGAVNGKIYTCTVSTTGPTSAAVNPTSCTIATNARADAQTAYNNLSPAALPGGTDPGAGQLGGLTLAPGIYQAAGGSFLITGSDLTLDAQGDPTAVWVFQTASTLTVGAPAAPRSIILINGAQAKNVFWQVGSSATINGAGGGTMVGTILANQAVSFSTVGNVSLVTLNGRAVGLNAAVNMTNTVINVPAP